MSYIITAEVYTLAEMNIGGNKMAVKARILSERNHYITFDVSGKFGEEQPRTKKLCEELINAGFVEFKISHSY